MDFNIIKYKILDSTNKKAQEIALTSKEGTVIIADEQSNSKGRFGRRWISAKGEGLWMSIILKPKIQVKHLSKIPLIASAAVNKSLEDIGIESKIKWPNDIMVNNKKVCGILTEMDAHLESINYLIVGIGVNINQKIEDFPEDIQAKAGSLRMFTDEEIDIDRLLKKILDRFKKYYLSFNENGDFQEVLNINRQNSILLGKEVYILNSDGSRRKGIALDINKNGQLVVEFPDGIEIVLAGQVSVRSKEGYI